MRPITLKENTEIIKCRCGNNTRFNVHSQQVCEDACEVWVECAVCGYDPTAKDTGSRFEDVWGGTDNGNAAVALQCWNDAIEEAENA